MRRRDFIAGTASAAMYLSTGLNSVGLPLQKLAKINIGIIGCGDRGTGLANLLQSIEGVEIGAMCDIIPFRLEAAKKYSNNKTRFYSDYRKLLEQENIDAVLITTPFSMHAEMAIEALDADKHIYCEKTMAYGFNDTKRLVEAARSSKKVFQTGHQYHSSRLYRHVAQLIKDDHIGKLALIECQWNRNGDWRRPVPDPKWEKMINWRMYREYSGGLTAELCSHQIDFSNWILNSKPAKVSGFGGVDYWKDGRETYDNVHILTEYPGGVKASYTSLTTNSKDDYRIQLLGKKGSIVITREQAWIYMEEKKKKELDVVDGVSGATANWQGSSGIQIELDHKEPSLQALLDFRDCIFNNTRPESNVESGAKVSVVVQMALDSMDNNTVEYWKDEYNFL